MAGGNLQQAARLRNQLGHGGLGGVIIALRQLLISFGRGQLYWPSQVAQAPATDPKDAPASLHSDQWTAPSGRRPHSLPTGLFASVASIVFSDAQPRNPT